jgi:hypothetical protein
MMVVFIVPLEEKELAAQSPVSDIVGEFKK